MPIYNLTNDPKIWKKYETLSKKVQELQTESDEALKQCLAGTLEWKKGKEKNKKYCEALDEYLNFQRHYFTAKKLDE